MALQVDPVSFLPLEEPLLQTDYIGHIWPHDPHPIPPLATVSPDLTADGSRIALPRISPASPKATKCIVGIK